MKQLYAPWRSNYARINDGQTAEDGCVFCLQFDQNQDEKNLIIRRFEHHAIILNRFPYNAGHLMVIPYAHVRDLHDLTPDARIELIHITSSIIPAMREILHCEGINVGLNMGKPAGGSIPGHLHLHILPRWMGDTNFLATLADTKPISFDLHEIFRKLKPSIDALKI